MAKTSSSSRWISSLADDSELRFAVLRVERLERRFLGRIRRVQSHAFVQTGRIRLRIGPKSLIHAHFGRAPIKRVARLRFSSRSPHETSRFYPKILNYYY